MTRHPTSKVILDEHSALSAVLRSIALLLAEHRRRATLPDFAVLRAMLFYIDEFPEKVHHTKESELLFPKIRARSAEGAEILDRLDADHAKSALRVRELEHELLGVEMMNEGPDGAARRVTFEKAMEAYIDAYLEHIRTEERVVLPLAERVLTAADWRELDTAFMQNRDPLTGPPGRRRLPAAVQADPDDGSRADRPRPGDGSDAPVVPGPHLVCRSLSAASSSRSATPRSARCEAGSGSDSAQGLDRRAESVTQSEQRGAGQQRAGQTHRKRRRLLAASARAQAMPKLRPEPEAEGGRDRERTHHERALCRIGGERGDEQRRLQQAARHADPAGADHAGATGRGQAPVQVDRLRC